LALMHSPCLPFNRIHLFLPLSPIFNRGDSGRQTLRQPPGSVLGSVLLCYIPALAWYIVDAQSLFLE
jgi:hypothetical protein